MGYIYILTSPIGKSYIGQTILPIETRFKRHRRESSKCVAIAAAIRKYGWENFEIDWYECPDDDLNFDEDLLVREMGTLAPEGYNLKEGGGNNVKYSETTKQKMSEAHRGVKHRMFGKKHTAETRQKMSESQSGRTVSVETREKMRVSHVGKPLSEEHKQKLSESQRGRFVSVETRQKISETHIGKVLSEEHKQKLSKAHLGKTHSEDTKQKMSAAQRGDKHHKSKRVYRYTLNGTLVDSFATGREAALYLNKKSSSHIAECANSKNKQKTAYGFKWSYIKF